MVFTDAIKLACGRIRPDYYHTVDSGHVPKEGRVSFPSGHSSISFQGMVMLALYLQGQFKLFVVESGGQFWKAVVSLTPLILSTFIAVSRTRDYHHK